MSRKVRAGASYIYQPVWFDKANPPFGARPGDLVTVVNLHGCPKANTMGMCHINDATGKFAGHVCTNSLIPRKEWKKRNDNLDNDA